MVKEVLKSMKSYVVYNWNGQLINLVDAKNMDEPLLNTNMHAVLLNLNFI